MDHHRAQIFGATKVVPARVVEPDLLTSANLDLKVVSIKFWGRHKAIYLAKIEVVHL